MAQGTKLMKIKLTIDAQRTTRISVNEMLKNHDSDYFLVLISLIKILITLSSSIVLAEKSFFFYLRLLKTW